MTLTYFEGKNLPFGKKPAEEGGGVPASNINVEGLSLDERIKESYKKFKNSKIALINDMAEALKQGKVESVLLATALLEGMDKQIEVMIREHYAKKEQES